MVWQPYKHVLTMYLTDRAHVSGATVTYLHPPDSIDVYGSRLVKPEAAAALCPSPLFAPRPLLSHPPQLAVQSVASPTAVVPWSSRMRAATTDPACTSPPPTTTSSIRSVVELGLGFLNWGLGDLVFWFGYFGSFCSCRFLLALKAKTTMAWRRHPRGSAWSIGYQLSAM